MKPVWLLDIDGVINACTKKPDRNVWSADDWQFGKAKGGDHEWPIWWSRQVVDFIRNVHESDLAEIRWHTTWQKDAAALEALVGLPSFPVADAPEYFESGSAEAAAAIREDRARTWWKLPAAERVVREERRPLIWTDDDITWSLARYDKDAGLRAYAPVLLISPQETLGLTKKQLRQISDFLAHQRLAMAADATAPDATPEVA